MFLFQILAQGHRLQPKLHIKEYKMMNITYPRLEIKTLFKYVVDSKSNDVNSNCGLLEFEKSNKHIMVFLPFCRHYIQLCIYSYFSD